MDSSQTPSPEENIRKAIGTATFNFMMSNQFTMALPLLAMSERLIQPYRGKVLLTSIFKHTPREYSYLVAPAAKGFEGYLLALAVHKGIIQTINIDQGISVGAIYAQINNHPARAKDFVLKEKDKSMVEHIYSTYAKARNKVLHYDADFFVKSVADADNIVKEILTEIRLAYQIFVGDPNPTQPLQTLPNIRPTSILFPVR